MPSHAKGFKLRDRVAANARIAPGDIVATKSALHSLGYYQPPEQDRSGPSFNPRQFGPPQFEPPQFEPPRFEPWTDGDMFKAIRDFQRDQGLKVDGEMAADGPTAERIDAALRTGTGFNPNQPRDWHGRWTVADNGGGHSDPHKKGPDRDISPDQAQKVLAEANRWAKEGTPYAASGQKYAGPNATLGRGGDCSGTTQKIFQAAGLKYSYATAAEFEKKGRETANDFPFREVDISEVRPGDVVTYARPGNNPGGWQPAHHMAIAINSKEIYSASNVTKPFQKWPIHGFAKSGNKIRAFRYQNSDRQS